MTRDRYESGCQCNDPRCRDVKFMKLRCTPWNIKKLANLKMADHYLKGKRKEAASRFKKNKPARMEAINTALLSQAVVKVMADSSKLKAD